MLKLSYPALFITGVRMEMSLVFYFVDCFAPYCHALIIFSLVSFDSVLFTLPFCLSFVSCKLFLLSVSISLSQCSFLCFFGVKNWVTSFYLDFAIVGEIILGCWSLLSSAIPELGLAFGRIFVALAAALFGIVVQEVEFNSGVGTPLLIQDKQCKQ